MTALMIQGTGSDVGKSLFVAGLCRLLANHGLRVRPFKPQNMSNNAAVTADGGEIGRAQALQARAARVALSVHMNPVLLKPQSDIGSQVIVQGRMIGTAKAREFQGWKPRLAAAVAESFVRLEAEADIVIVEGAGSAAEVNLRAGDIANMGFAQAHNVPVVLLADIDRGGVIAQVVGTQAVIDPADAAMIRGFVVNKFRGDPALFEAGMALIAERTGWPALGLVPYFHDAARLPAEDGQVLAASARPPLPFEARLRLAPQGEGSEAPAASRHGEVAAPAALEPRRRDVTIAVPVLPHISNFDDLDPLVHEPGVRLLMLKRGQPIPGDADLVILPGSKATIADLAALRAEGWDIDILAHRRRGGHVLGICGGFQMLGRVIADPQGIEGAPGSVAGLGLLDVETVMTADKTLVEVTGIHAGGALLRGYEMHVGETEGPDRARPFAILADGTPDGATSTDGRVNGTYLHGIFTSDTYRADLLALFGGQSTPGHDAETDRVLDALADHIAAHVDLARMFDGVIPWPPSPPLSTGATPSG